jgi:hypothetical protein
MAHEAGKGDKRRPEDSEAFRNNFDAIFRKQAVKVFEEDAVQAVKTGKVPFGLQDFSQLAMAEVQALERDRMSGKNTTQESVDKQEKQ